MRPTPPADDEAPGPGHFTSAAVWDVPSPVASAGRFMAKAGVSCSAACRLTDRPILVRDQAGAVVGHGRLGEAPWPGTRALYWAEVEVTAPAATGVAHWVVEFAADAAHSPASMPFSFLVDRAAEHRLTLAVVRVETRAPIAGAEVRCGAYRACTGDDGVASLELPAGAYDISVTADGFESRPVRLDVETDLAIEVEAARTLTDAEREEALERFEARQWG